MVRLVNRVMGRARKFLGSYVHATRHDMRLPLYVSLFDPRKNAARTPSSSSMSGYLRDISKTGVSLVVPSLRFGNHCLISGHYPLTVTLQLPNGVASIQVAPVRYDRVKEGQLERSYLIGARIIQITDPDRKNLVHYIHQLKDRRAASFSFVQDAKSV